MSAVRSTRFLSLSSLVGELDFWSGTPAGREDSVQPGTGSNQDLLLLLLLHSQTKLRTSVQYLEDEVCLQSFSVHFPIPTVSPGTESSQDLLLLLLHSQAILGTSVQYLENEICLQSFSVRAAAELHSFSRDRVEPGSSPPPSAFPSHTQNVSPVP